MGSTLKANSPETSGAKVAFSPTLEQTTGDAPVYDRRTAFKLQAQSSRRAKVYMLQALIMIGTMWYTGLLYGAGVSLEFLVPFKIAPILLMIQMVLVLSDRSGYGARIAWGLACCALGNICFELEGRAMIAGDPPLFMIGLGFFMLGNAAYASAFIANKVVVSASTATLPIAVAAAVFGVLQPHLPPKMFVPILVYAIAMAGVMLLAFSREPQGYAPIWSWRCASAGALLFTLTSTILGYHRFVAAVPHAKLLFMASYYLSQYAMAMSVRGAQARPLTKALGSVENFANGQSFRRWT